MVINVSEHVRQCYSNQDGEILFNLIKPLMDKGEKADVSFKDIDSVTSSFVNSAFIELLQYYPFAYIRANLRFSDSARHINEIIKKRFRFETEERTKMNEKISACAAC